MTTTKPLVVEYSEFRPASVPVKTLVISSLSAELFESWRKAIDAGVYDNVVLCGRAVCTGWRIQVEREVNFVRRTFEVEYDIIAQNQAEVRIVKVGTLSPNEVSPYNLIQEWVQKDRNYPWRVLVVCTLLNRTHGRGVRAIVDQLFELCPEPKDMLTADLTEILRPLGLKNMREKRLKHLTEEYLAGVNYEFMAGVGKYAIDCLKIFCGGMVDVQTDDQWLVPYLNWRKNGGQEVKWDKRSYEAWRAGE